MFTPFDSEMEGLAISTDKYNLRWPDYHTSVLAAFRWPSDHIPSAGFDALLPEQSL